MHRWCLLNLTVQGFSLNLTVRGVFIKHCLLTLFILHVSGNGPGKLLDPRKKMVERIVRFGDSPNVSINTIFEQLV